MEKNIVHDASQKDPRKTCDGFPPHCQHTALLQAVWLHDPRTSGAVIGARVEQSSESFQPEAQHGFRSGRTMEEHILTTNLILDKSKGTGLPLWIISLDLSKAFDTVKWDTLWEALRRQNISDQLIWILQCLYHDQTCVVCDGAGASRKFDILSGVRQGCVLSPRLFCAALELAMSEWKLQIRKVGSILETIWFVYLRFADDVLIFANTKEEAQNLLDSLVRHLAAAGLMLNTSKTVALTTEAQPPSFIQVGDSHLVMPNHTDGLVACCALALVRTLMWNTIYSKQPRLSRNTVGCYNARIVLSNTDCVIFKQLFLQQHASLQSTDLYAENIYKNMTFNFESLFVALWGLHQARIGQRNGIVFCTSGICVWIAGPVPVEFLPGHRSV